ncbi:transposase [Paenibacillus larvae]|nr:transposase [Paenibacillus larvae]MDT2254378.1 transposase [Paenibacillus larvae]
MRRTKYSNEFKGTGCKGSSGNQKQSSRGKTLRLASQYATPMGKEYESGKWGVISVRGFPPLETKKLSQENDHLKRLLGEKDLEIAILRDLVKEKPSLADKVEVAEIYIQQGYAITLVLRLVKVRSTYYYIKNKKVMKKGNS